MEQASPCTRFNSFDVGWWRVFEKAKPSDFAFYDFSLSRAPEADRSEYAGYLRQRGIVALEKR
jgi:hypothetical protein